MKARRGFVNLIGQTPLFELSSLSKRSGCTILVKAEFMNPGGSVKDRAALSMVRSSETSGALSPGGIIVEGTAGNTGIGLIHVANACGYKCVLYLPNTQSVEKMHALTCLGADVRAVPAVPFADDMNYNHQAKRFAQETEGGKNLKFISKFFFK